MLILIIAEALQAKFSSRPPTGVSGGGWGGVVGLVEPYNVCNRATILRTPAVSVPYRDHHKVLASRGWRWGGLWWWWLCLVFEKHRQTTTNHPVTLEREGEKNKRAALRDSNELNTNSCFLCDKTKHCGHCLWQIITSLYVELSSL